MAPPDAARADSRKAHWSGGGPSETPVFVFEALEAGNRLTGPALVEARDTTYVIEPGWRFTLDPYRNGILEPVLAAVRAEEEKKR